MYNRFLVTSFLCLFVQLISIAQTSPEAQKQVVSNCAKPTAKADLDINNVRATIMNGGDMWWDGNKAMYEIPKGSKINSLFAGALWIGGLDAGNQIRVAAQTYRQAGHDFWPGPIDSILLSTSSDSCLKYDKIWKLNRTDVEFFVNNYNNPNYTIPDEILTWPGGLAPFVDVDGDLNYNPRNGDYPAYAIGNTPQNCNGHLLGDQTLWWVINDVGNNHTSSYSSKMGVEVRTQAFAFKTYDEINDMTFYQYKMINRSNNTYHDTYFGTFVDSNIGGSFDDYIGCDVARGMGYGYNGYEMDLNAGFGEYVYRSHPPAIGVDYVGGPLADPFDGIDNDRNGVIDELGERIKMSRFLYITGDSPLDYPQGHVQFYNYLRGYNQIGVPISYNHFGFFGTTPCQFHFPGDSDPQGWGTNGVPQAPWSEVTDYLNGHNTPSDRRFVMSAGAFTFQPGAVQTITKAVVWARDTAGNNLASIEKLKLADDKAQLLFDNCFSIECVPPLPAIFYTANELDVQFIYPNAGTNFTWTFGDCGYNVSHERNPKHTYCKPGTYTVCLSVSNECGSSSTCTSITLKFPNPGFQLQRIEGKGNSGYAIDFANGMHDSVLNNPYHRVFKPIYDFSSGPIRVEVIDKTAVPQDIFTVQLNGVSNTSGWKMYRANSNDTVYSDSTILIGTAQLIPQWGMLVQVKKMANPGVRYYHSQEPLANIPIYKNGFITSSIYFSDDSKKWYGGVADSDSAKNDNWIRSGTTVLSNSYADYAGIDDLENYEKIIGGTFAPYRLCGSTPVPLGTNNYLGGPAWHRFITLSSLQKCASIDLVITADKSKWSRSVVFETCDEQNLAYGGAGKLNLRLSPSVNKDGLPDSSGTNGMGWFPGYAINLETGERLNIAFGEDSWLSNYNGRDMIWNPTSDKFTPTGKPLFGGKHYIYIFGHNGDERYGAADANLPYELKDVPKYDSCQAIYKLMYATQQLFPAVAHEVYKREVFADAMWVGIPLLNEGQELLASDVTIKIRVAKPFETYATSSTPLNNNFPMYQFDARYMNNPGNHLIEVKENEVKLFPNPFATFTTILFSNEKCEAHQLSIYDVTGRLIREYTNITTDRILVEKENLNAGVYFYKLSKNGEKGQSGKMIIR